MTTKGQGPAKPGTGDGGVPRMGWQHVVGRHEFAARWGRALRVMLGQVSLLLPGSLRNASRWFSGEAGFQSTEQRPVLALTLSRCLCPNSSFPVPHTFLRQSPLRAGQGIAWFPDVGAGVGGSGPQRLRRPGH